MTMFLKYKILQYPQNKEINPLDLSYEQNQIRQNSVRKYTYGEKMKCRICGIVHTIDYFYVKDKITERRATKCKDCTMKARGVVEIGKLRFSAKIAEKGFRRCSVCKEIKPLTEYKKCKGKYLGLSHNCYECSARLHDEYIKKQQKEIGVHYIKSFGKLKGINEFNESIISELRNEILSNREKKTVISIF